MQQRLSKLEAAQRLGVSPSTLYRRHQYATEWLLHSLEPSRPYDETTWPTTSDFT